MASHGVRRPLRSIKILSPHEPSLIADAALRDYLRANAPDLLLIVFDPTLERLPGDEAAASLQRLWALVPAAFWRRQRALLVCTHAMEVVPGETHAVGFANWYRETAAAASADPEARDALRSMPLVVRKKNFWSFSSPLLYILYSVSDASLQVGGE